MSAAPSHVAAAITLQPFIDAGIRRLGGLEQIGRCALLVDGLGRVLECTSAVTFGDGLQLTNGFLQTPRVVDRHKLARFLSTVMGLESGPVRTPATLTLPRPSGLRPWLIDGVNCGSSTGTAAECAALLLITDVEKPARLSIQLLSVAFGLTATEAKVAGALARGKPLQDAAVELGISAGHARQRLKSIFQKTGTSRQGELIALLAKLA